MTSINRYIKILNVCVCVCNGSGKFGGGTTVVTHDLRIYTLFGVCAITSERTQGASAEEDTVGEQQLKQTQLGSSS